MELLDRYMLEVRNHLPRKMKADLEAEIRSLIEDNLEDRSQAVGQEIDEEMVVEVLREFGSPEKVAASYLPEKYLIGPQLYPAFMLTLRIVLIVIGSLAMIGIGINLAQSGATIWQSLLEGVAGLYSALLQALAIVVFIFAIIQWAQPNRSDEPKAWDPRQLKNVTPPDVVRPAEPIFEIVFSIIALVFLNFYPHMIGMISYSGGQWVFAPALSQEFFRYLPWINLVLVVKLVESIILLRQGNWQTATRWLSAAGSILSIILLYSLLTGPALVAFGAETFAIFDWSASTAADLERLLNGMLRVGLGIALVFEGYSLIMTGYHLLKHKQLKFEF
jgi:hypothetical protein